MVAAGVVEPHDVAFGVDPLGNGGGKSTGDVDGGECAIFAQQKAMDVWVEVEPHDVAFGVDPKGHGAVSTANVDSGETVFLFLFLCKTTADRAEGTQQGKAQDSQTRCSCMHGGLLLGASIVCV